jgi:hypothetical protein
MENPKKMLQRALDLKVTVPREDTYAHEDIIMKHKVEGNPSNVIDI